MKKTIAILLILVIGMVGVFAANNNSTDLKLAATVSGKYGLKIATSGVSGVTLAEKVSSFTTGLTEVTTQDFDDENLTATLYVNYMTNQKIKAAVTASMYALESANTSTPIGYTVTSTYGGSDVTTTVSNEDLERDLSTPKTIKLFEETAETNAMRVISQAFKIDIAELDWNAATADEDYTTTWTVDLTVNS